MRQSRNCLLLRWRLIDLQFLGHGSNNSRGTEPLCGKRPNGASFTWKQAIVPLEFLSGIVVRPRVDKWVEMSSPPLIFQVPHLTQAV